ncbi:hypothetical protein [Robertmurraya massiliosenegalensis]|uniref:hypothetical protein n=1 Tax=Robertmurraya massiliosenegalensis TaxID=1287657 RepID=UPI0012B56944|nr:hypothetical protein [Robertmurraya massiliosenegalensis]
MIRPDKRWKARSGSRPLTSAAGLKRLEGLAAGAGQRKAESARPSATSTRRGAEVRQ